MIGLSYYAGNVAATTTTESPDRVSISVSFDGHLDIEVAALDMDVLDVVSQLRQTSSSPTKLGLNIKLQNLEQRAESVPSSPRTASIQAAIRVCKLDNDGLADYALLEDLLRSTSMTPVDMRMQTESLETIQERVMSLIEKAENRITNIKAFEKKALKALSRYDNQFSAELAACDILMDSAAEWGVARRAMDLRQAIQDIKHLVANQLSGRSMDQEEFHRLLTAADADLPIVIDTENGTLTTIRSILAERVVMISKWTSGLYEAKLLATDAVRIVNEFIELFTSQFELIDIEVDHRIDQWTQFVKNM